MKLRLTACTLLSLAVPLTAPAADDTEPAEMAVRGTRAASDPALPAVTDGVDVRRPADLNVVNVQYGLSYLPSLLVRKRYIGDRNGVVAPRSSGSLQGARSLAYVDGMPPFNLLGNSFGNTPRRGMLAPEEIARMDVAYGPYLASSPATPWASRCS
jgi:iron complex outermembrane receptor protein